MYRFVAVIATLFCTACAQLPYSVVPEPLPSQMHAVVFDIDGTLTPNVFAIYEARRDAAKAVKAFSEKGYQVVYLSARSGWVSSGIPSWLERNDFPVGTVHVAQRSEERKAPDAYKTEMLRKFIAAGWKIDYAYGDSSTDLAAYAAAGIPKDHVFALRRRGRSSCQAGVAAECIEGWSEHLEYVLSSVPGVRIRE